MDLRVCSMWAEEGDWGTARLGPSVTPSCHTLFPTLQRCPWSLNIQPSNPYIVSASLPIPSSLAQMIHRLFRDGTQRNVPSGLDGHEKLPTHDVKGGAIGASAPRIGCCSFPREAGRSCVACPGICA